MSFACRCCTCAVDVQVSRHAGVAVRKCANSAADLQAAASAADLSYLMVGCLEARMHRFSVDYIGLHPFSVDHVVFNGIALVWGQIFEKWNLIDFL